VGKVVDMAAAVVVDENRLGLDLLDQVVGEVEEKVGVVAEVEDENHRDQVRRHHLEEEPDGIHRDQVRDHQGLELMQKLRKVREPRMSMQCF
jgi:hypothetical protein